MTCQCRFVTSELRRSRLSTLIAEGTHARLFRPGLALVTPDVARDDGHLRRAFERLERAMDQWCAETKRAA